MKPIKEGFAIITIRKAEERGHVDHGWLDTWHTFSFSSYFDPAHMGFGPLRVINDDIVRAGQGFGMHGHRDMEIITYIIDGTLAHKDSVGSAARISAGEVQRMAAGTGIRHSEFNPDDGRDVHLLQIWIEPSETGVKPEYEEKMISRGEKLGRLKLIASPDARDGSMRIHQDAFVLATVLEPGMEVSRPLAPGRSAWVHIAAGNAVVNGLEARAGDGFAFTDEKSVTLKSADTAEILLFDLP